MSEKKPLISNQPTNYNGDVGAPPAYTDSSSTSGRGSGLSDVLLLDKLNNIQQFQMHQGNIFLEAVTSGVWPNVFVISDRSRLTPVLGDPEGRQVATPVFIVQEESGCLARCCCPGNQAFTAKIWHAKLEAHYGDKCCCFYGGDKFVPDFENGVALTLERDGCCNKCIGCFICTKKCQDELYVHEGDVNIVPGSSTPENGGYFASSILPVGGGGCKPRFQLNSRHDGGSGSSIQQFATTTGPGCYGGWLSACSDTSFGIARQGTMEKYDIAQIHKKKADTCGNWMLELCTKVDKYDIDFGASYQALQPQEKAAVLANAVHIDYRFFENDPPPCYVQRNGDNSVLICTLCLSYCWGCACPIQICIPLNGKN